MFMINNTNKHRNGLVDHHSDNEDNSTQRTIVIINCVLNAPLMLISILGNALVLAAIIRTPSIRSTSMIMLSSLVVSDLLVGFLAQPIFIAAELLTDYNFVYDVWSVIGPSLCRVSLMTIAAIAVDRFLALHYHMRYASLVTESRVQYTLVIIWLIVFFLSVFHFWSARLYRFIAAVSVIICLIISTFSYIRIYRIVRRHQSDIHAQQRAVQSSNAEDNFILNMGRLKRSAMNTFVFYIVLITCYLPMYVILTLYGTSVIEWEPKWHFATTLVFSNSSINPFLYCWRLRELRAAVVKTAKQMLCKQTEDK